jgi:hypothetical protein
MTLLADFPARAGPICAGGSSSLISARAAPPKRRQASQRSWLREIIYHW